VFWMGRWLFCLNRRRSLLLLFLEVHIS